MADIELVIKIPEDEYRWIKKSDETAFANIASKECMLYAIKTGTPLPKGHGDLKDVSPIIDDIAKVRTYSYQQAIDLDVFKRKLLNAPTVVEADKENQNND